MRSPLAWGHKKYLLLGASYLFYAAWNPPFAILLAISTLIDYLAGQQLAKRDDGPGRRLWLCLSLCANLGMLSFFKYGGFFLSISQDALGLVGISYQPPLWNIILPVGISFYTFQTLSYTIDLYRRRIGPARSFSDFALYVSFFPQLVAGPIVRAADLLPQFHEEKHATAQQLGWGLFLVSLGLFQKVVIADNIAAPTVEAVFDAGRPVPTIDAWLGVLAFAVQIFNDFAGYSTCAIGIALCIGFHLPDNFNRPYAALGFSDFWRRWHITLSSWLRDYLYIPLGGNRHGALRTACTLLIVMALGGLWHGAAWTFILWGVLHGVFLIIEHGLRRCFGKHAWTQHRAVRAALIALTFVLILFTWVPFRAADFGMSMLTWITMLGAGPAVPYAVSGPQLLLIPLVAGALFIWHCICRQHSLEKIAAACPHIALVGIWSFMLICLLWAQGGSDAFIYFQF